MIKKKQRIFEGTEKVPLSKQVLKKRLNKTLILFNLRFLFKFNFMRPQGLYNN
jgi:hypothetical protein